MATTTCTLYEAGAVLFDADGRAVRQASKVLKTFDVTGDSCDSRREAARVQAKEHSGREPSISCATDGSIVATVHPRSS